MLELKDLRFSVSVEDDAGKTETKNIIDGLSHTFEKGRMYTITGPNGSGKTTMAKLVMGIHQPTGGQILFDGRDVTHTPLNERAQMGLAYGFQNPARFKGITFRDLLSMAAGTDKEDDLIGILGRVGICSLSFLDKPVDATLSGGEIKKVELSTIIARDPKLAIYDEPDTGIDLWTIGPMVELLKKEQREKQTTTLIVSHNLAFLEAADEVILIKEGRVAFNGSFEEARPLLEDLSLCGYRDVCEDTSDARCFR
jgi:Fe-S cluster assembly ATP-binding protein